MASQKAVSKLAAKLGARADEAIQKAAVAPVEFGPAGLPPGIQKGVAKLSRCYFEELASGTQFKKADGTSAKGEYVLRMVGVMCEPFNHTYNGQVIRVYGQQTRPFPEQMFDTANKDKDGKAIETSLDQHIHACFQHFKRLAGEEFTHGATTGDDLEALAEQLDNWEKETGRPIYFWVNTTPKKDKDGKETGAANEFWGGSVGLEDYVPPTPPGMQVDNTAPKANIGPPSSQKTPMATQSAPQKPPVAIAAPEESPELSLAELASIAMGEDEPSGQAARDELKRIALETGIDESDVDNADGWTDVVVLIEMARGSSGGSEPEPDKFVPALKMVYGYQKRDANGNVARGKDKKPLAPTDYQCVLVNEASGTCDLKNLDDKSIVRGVPFDHLIVS